MNIIQACQDKNLFGAILQDKASWGPWLSVLRCVFGLPLDDADKALLKEVSGRDAFPADGFREVWLACGRRSGKSFVLALVAVWLACFKEWRGHLTAGERGTVMVLASDRRQAGVIFGYVRGLIAGNPMLAALIARETADTIELSNRTAIEVHACSFRSVRGRTLLAALCDEIAFWRSEDSANPDSEILAALRPAMATIPQSMLLVASSPYRKAGALWQVYQSAYGKDDADALVIQAPSRSMNPSLPETFVERELARDPVGARAEYLAEFRSDIAGFLAEDWIEAAARDSSHDIPPAEGVSYQAFVDPSGGRGDAFTLAIAHKEGALLVIDAVRARKPPFGPEAVADEFATVAKRYRCRKVTGDHYSGEWVKRAFEKAGVQYEAAGKPKSQLYLETEPAFAEGRVSLPANQTLLSELRGLERRTHRSGRDSVDHGPGAHDDLANAVCGALWLVRAKRKILIWGSAEDWGQTWHRPRAIGSASRHAHAYDGGDFDAWARGR